jgi:hypothetical protein
MQSVASVLDDFTHTTQIFRAACNRVHNGLETSKVDVVRAESCIALVDNIHNYYTRLGQTLTAGLAQAMACTGPKAAECAAEYLKDLNKFNRRMAEAAQLLESDLSDYQPEIPDYEFMKDKPKPRDVTGERVMEFTKFMGKLTEHWTNINK